MSWEIQKEKAYLRPDTDILFQASQTSKCAYMHIYTAFDKKEMLQRFLLNVFLSHLTISVCDFTQEF